MSCTDLQQSLHCYREEALLVAVFETPTCNVGRVSDVTSSFIFGLGFKLPLGAVNGPSLETFRTGPRSLRPWGETGLTAVATWKEFLNAISMGKLLACHF